METATLCMMASLDKKPAQTPQAATITQVPTTGAPASDLITPAAIIAIGLIGGGIMLARRRTM